ncbi:MAG: hypothetical protein HY587_00850 [Candidatus Omnitrophica bacterium]|nr:hypothetical protein [Candidatus Omnitrophota bacterium]
MRIKISSFPRKRESKVPDPRLRGDDVFSHRRAIWFKLVAAVLCVAIPATEIGPAYANVSSQFVGARSSRPSDLLNADLSSAETTPLHDNVKHIPPDQITVPPDLGTIQEIFHGSKNSTVIHIQDAHGNLSAQENIGRLVKYLHETYGINLLTVEGAAGKIDMRGVRDFPDAEARKKVARRYLESFDLAGDEYYVISENPDLAVYGAERMLKYYFNRDQFFRAQALSKKLKPVIGRFQVSVRNLERKVYGKDLLKFTASARRFEEHHEFLSAHLRYLRDTFAETYSAADFSVRYSALSVILQEISSAIDVGNALAEIRSLEKMVRDSLVANETEKRLVAFSEFSDIFGKLLKLSLTSNDYAQLKQNAAQLSSSYFQREFESLAARTRWHKEFDSLFNGVKAALDFYKNAEARNSELAKNTAKAMQKENAPAAMIISGGFHTEGLKKIWREQNISFAIIRPNVNETDSTITLAERGFAPWRASLRDQMVGEMRLELSRLKMAGFGTEKPDTEEGKKGGVDTTFRKRFRNVLIGLSAAAFAGAVSYALGALDGYIALKSYEPQKPAIEAGMSFLGTAKAYLSAATHWPGIKLDMITGVLAWSITDAAIGQYLNEGRKIRVLQSLIIGAFGILQGSITHLLINGAELIFNPTPVMGLVSLFLFLAKAVIKTLFVLIGGTVVSLLYTVPVSITRKVLGVRGVTFKSELRKTGDVLLSKVLAAPAKTFVVVNLLSQAIKVPAEQFWDIIFQGGTAYLMNREDAFFAEFVWRKTPAPFRSVLTRSWNVLPAPLRGWLARRFQDQPHVGFGAEGTRSADGQDWGRPLDQLQKLEIPRSVLRAGLTDVYAKLLERQAAGQDWFPKGTKIMSEWFAELGAHAGIAKDSPPFIKLDEIMEFIVEVLIEYSVAKIRFRKEWPAIVNFYEELERALLILLLKADDEETVDWSLSPDELDSVVYWMPDRASQIMNERIRQIYNPETVLSPTPFSEGEIRLFLLLSTDARSKMVGALQVLLEDNRGNLTQAAFNNYSRKIDQLVKANTAFPALGFGVEGEENLSSRYDRLRQSTGQIPSAAALSDLVGLPIPVVRRISRRLDLKLSDKPDVRASPFALYAAGFTDEIPPKAKARLHRTRGDKLGFVLSTTYIGGIPDSFGKPGDFAIVDFKSAGDGSRDLIVSVRPEKPRDAAELSPVTVHLLVNDSGNIRLKRRTGPRGDQALETSLVAEEKQKALARRHIPPRDGSRQPGQRPIRPSVLEARHEMAVKKYPDAKEVLEALDQWFNFTESLKGRKALPEEFSALIKFYKRFLGEMESSMSTKSSGEDFFVFMSRRYLATFRKTERALTENQKRELSRFEKESAGFNLVLAEQFRLLRYLGGALGEATPTGEAIQAGKSAKAILEALRSYGTVGGANAFSLHNLRRQLSATILVVNEARVKANHRLFRSRALLSVFDGYRSSQESLVRVGAASRGIIESENIFELFEKELNSAKREKKRRGLVSEDTAKSVQESLDRLETFVVSEGSGLAQHLRRIADFFVTLKLYIQDSSANYEEVLKYRDRFFHDILPLAIKFYLKEEDFYTLEEGDREHDGLFMRIEDMMDYGRLGRGSGFGTVEERYALPFVRPKLFSNSIKELEEKFFRRLSRKSRVLIFHDSDGDGIVSGGLMRALVVGQGKVPLENIHLFMEGQFEFSDVFQRLPPDEPVFVIFTDINGALARFADAVPFSTRQKMAAVISIDHHSVERPRHGEIFVHPEQTWGSSVDSFYFPTGAQTFFMALHILARLGLREKAEKFYTRYLPLAVFSLRHDIALIDQMEIMEPWHQFSDQAFQEGGFLKQDDTQVIDGLLRLDRLIVPWANENRFDRWLNPLLDSLLYSLSDEETNDAYRHAFKSMSEKIEAHVGDVAILRQYVEERIREAIPKVKDDEPIVFQVAKARDFDSLHLSHGITPRVRVDLAGNLAFRLTKKSKRSRFPVAVVVFEQDHRDPNLYHIRFRSVRERISVGDLIFRSGLGRRGRLEKANARLTLGQTINPMTRRPYRSVEEVQATITAQALKTHSGFGTDAAKEHSKKPPLDQVNENILKRGGYEELTDQEMINWWETGFIDRKSLPLPPKRFVRGRIVKISLSDRKISAYAATENEFRIRRKDGDTRFLTVSDLDPNRGLVVTLYRKTGASDKFYNAWQHYQWLGEFKRPARTNLAAWDFWDFNQGKIGLIPIEGRFFETNITTQIRKHRGWDVYYTARVTLFPRSDQQKIVEITVDQEKVSAKGSVLPRIAVALETDPDHGLIAKVYWLDDYLKGPEKRWAKEIGSAYFDRDVNYFRSIDLNQLSVIRVLRGESSLRASRFYKTHVQTINEDGEGLVAMKYRVFESGHLVQKSFRVKIPSEIVIKHNLKAGSAIVLRVEEDMNHGNFVAMYTSEKDFDRRPSKALMAIKYFPHSAHGKNVASERTREGRAARADFGLLDIFAAEDPEKRKTIKPGRGVKIEWSDFKKISEQYERLVLAEPFQPLNRITINLSIAQQAISDDFMSSNRKAEIYLMVKKDSDYGAYLELHAGSKPIQHYWYSLRAKKFISPDFDAMRITDWASGQGNIFGQSVKIIDVEYALSRRVGDSGKLRLSNEGRGIEFINKNLRGIKPLLVGGWDILHGEVLEIYDADKPLEDQNPVAVYKKRKDGKKLVSVKETFDAFVEHAVEKHMERFRSTFARKRIVAGQIAAAARRKLLLLASRADETLDKQKVESTIKRMVERVFEAVVMRSESTGNLDKLFGTELSGTFRKKSEDNSHRNSGGGATGFGIKAVSKPYRTIFVSGFGAQIEEALTKEGFPFRAAEDLRIVVVDKNPQAAEITAEKLRKGIGIRPNQVRSGYGIDAIAENWLLNGEIYPISRKTDIPPKFHMNVVENAQAYIDYIVYLAESRLAVSKFVAKAA